MLIAVRIISYKESANYFFKEICSEGFENANLIAVSEIIYHFFKYSLRMHAIPDAVPPNKSVHPLASRKKQSKGRFIPSSSLQLPMASVAGSGK